MRASRIRNLMLGGAVLLAVASPARLGAQVPLVVGGPWEMFEWFTGVGPTSPAVFQVAAVAPIRLRVTDDGVSGDAFDILVNGTPFTTPSVVPSVFTTALTGNAAWADPALSKWQTVLSPGNYTIQLAVRETAPGFDYGEGFIRADLAPPVGVIPEPASVSLVAMGLAGLALAARRRRGR